MSVYYLETGSTDPCYNLAFEQYVLEHKTEGDWLMLWQNANAVIIGRNQNTAEEVDPAFIERHRIAVVRRMTGGGNPFYPKIGYTRKVRWQRWKKPALEESPK